MRKLLKKLKHNDKLIIAEFDSTANDTSRANVTGFPTLKFWKGSDKTAPIDFEGEREDVKSYIEFIQKHASNPITVQTEEL